tara:strand:+ start:461 stop:1585 length:1125 start_codon:yes stop_codon:yes gene_type:complete
MILGKAHLDFRYRYEDIDQDGKLKDASASTLKTRLNYRTGSYKDLSLFAEMDDVSYIGNSNFNNTRNGKTEYPTVADPKGTDINQFYIDYKNDNLLGRLGRQRILLDNQRFIGGVGWRQNEQTYDSISMSVSATPNNKFFYSYIENVSRLFGPEKGSPAKNLESSNHLLHYEYSNKEIGKIVGYGYFLDFDDAVSLSSDTLGVRYTNSLLLDDSWSVPIALEYARQEDAGENPVSYSANYYLISGGLKTPAITASINYEVLGGDKNSSGKKFNTPLATLHAHQGWADKFLSTPDAGIKDIFIKISGKVFGTKAMLVYHDFSAADGEENYGNELDISIAKKLSDHFSLLLKYASYSENSFSTDVNKVWFQVTTKF